MNKTKHVPAENKLNKLSEKVKAISTKDYSLLLGRMYFLKSNEGFPNMFIYQRIFSTVKYKNTSTEYAISWKSKGVYNPKLIALNSDFLPNLKYLKKGLKFNNNPIIKI